MDHLDPVLAVHTGQERQIRAAGGDQRPTQESF